MAEIKVNTLNRCLFIVLICGIACTCIFGVKNLRWLWFKFSNWNILGYAPLILQLQETSQPPPPLPPSCLPFLLVIKLLIDKIGSLLKGCLILIITCIVNGWTKLWHAICTGNTEFWKYLPGDPTWVLSSLPLERLFQWMQEISASFYSLYLLKKNALKWSGFDLSHAKAPTCSRVAHTLGSD